MDSAVYLLSRFPVRKTRKQKAAFREEAVAYLKTLGYDAKVETGKFGCQNLVFGSTETAQYLVTAHYDTCARLPIANFITPCNGLLFAAQQILMILIFTVVFLAVTNGCILLLGDHRFSALLGMFSILGLLILMLFGPANPNNVNDNTSGVLTVLEIARSIPENQRSKVAFALFDLEEGGLIGAASYRKAHKKATDRQTVLNLDCVGQGNEMLFFPGKAVLKNIRRSKPIYSVCGYFGEKSLLVADKGFAMYPSDQMVFPYGVGIAALKRGKYGLYLDDIHTPKDTKLDEKNVNILRAAIVSMVCRG